MKTKQEIDNLAESKFNEKYYPISKKGYIEGYTQCQEDMAKELEQVDTVCPKCKGINQYFIEKNGDYKCAYTDCEHTFNKTRLI